ELDKEKTTVKFPVIPENGKSETRHWVKHYNLDVIIAVGYRINSYQATQFRIWATNVLKGIILKSSPDDKENELLSKLFGRNYFDQLLERIRETRLSERQYFQKLADIYAECSIDYEPNSTLTNDFFKNIQNRLHWAITHKTAAQIIYERADAGKPSMGLMNWKNAPNGKIMKSDAGIAKNYLSEEEVSRMNILATSLLDFAENQVLRGNIMTMEQWLRKLDIYLEVSNYDLLPDKVDITPEQARQKAEEEYEEFKNRLKSK
ncbi:MAG TPA: RhuM family protein, partial [Paludibacter sp.]|nr:RhuM family protein [Paludibacter sp.]